MHQELSVPGDLLLLILNLWVGEMGHRSETPTPTLQPHPTAALPVMLGDNTPCALQVKASQYSSRMKNSQPQGTVAVHSDTRNEK